MKEYAGFGVGELLKSPSDLLGEVFLRGDAASLTAAAELLPEPREGAYVFLSGLESPGAILVDEYGNLYDQATGHFSWGRGPRDAEPIYSSGERTRVRFEMTDSPAPVFVWSRREGETFEAFVHPYDPGLSPMCLLRITREGKTECLRVSAKEHSPVSPEEYAAQKAEAEAIWSECFTPAELTLPEGELRDVYVKCLKNALCTFSADAPRYGHAAYGEDAHAHFPPTVLTAVEAFYRAGLTKRAAGVLAAFFRACVRPDGRLYYYGPSPAESGQLLWLLSRLPDLMRPEYLPKVRAMAENLLSLCGESGLVEGCAEADTRLRSAVYVNNCLWVSRGLEAAGMLLERLGTGERYVDAAAELLARTRQALSRETDDGIVPFRLGYPARAVSYSSCEPEGTLTETEREAYLASGLPDAAAAGYAEERFRWEQDLSENTYANYRYIPEMLSSGLLTKNQADKLVAYRRAHGGECLGMTRFFDRLDDWPVFHYARYLLEAGEYARYRMLLYAHGACHGLRAAGVYYEQVSLTGGVAAEDCVPSLLTLPLMLEWMLAFEPTKREELWLGAGIPQEWLAEGPVGVKEMPTGFGPVSWEVRDGVLRYTLPDAGMPAFFIAGEEKLPLTKREGMLALPLE